MKHDSVSLSLDKVLEEIAAVEAQLNHEGSAAFRNSHYEDAKRIVEAGMQLRIFSKKLAALKNEWTSGIDLKTRKRVKVDTVSPTPSHTKGPKQNLRITLPNGRVIQRPTAAAAFVDTIEMLGVERVRALGITECNIPLVGTKPHPKYTQKHLGQWLVCTHSNTDRKKLVLERIGKALHQPIHVDIIPACPGQQSLQKQQATMAAMNPRAHRYAIASSAPQSTHY
jgi:hypothetical protein